MIIVNTDQPWSVISDQLKMKSASSVYKELNLSI